ncbi:hypothetical protein DFH27DRAFT_158880 [Peziza echinospora]|nr:hypothetical protein DFH27DRAFT_158880 [Peziza echinospora]
MTFYPAPPRDPYRASTGSMPPRTPNRSSSYSVAGSPHSHRTRHDEPRDDSTVYGGHTPNQSSSALHPSSTGSHAHHRRSSNAGHEPPPASMSRYYHGGAFVEPAVSHGGDRRRRSSLSAPVAPPPAASVPRSHAHRSWSSYHHEIDIKEDSSRRGSTRIPRKYVNKEALQQMSLLYEEDRSGALIVLKALTRPEIEHLVELTEYIRAHRPGHSSSHKREKHVRIITEPTDAVPHPEDVHNHHSRAPTLYTTGPPPSTSGHYYAASSVPRSSGSPNASIYTLSRAGEDAKAAESKARRREYRAESSGSWQDDRRVAKARHEAEENARRAEDASRKERRREREVVLVR